MAFSGTYARFPGIVCHELAGCLKDAISFAGFEKVEKRWCYQVWYCETRASQE